MENKNQKTEFIPGRGYRVTDSKGYYTIVTSGTVKTPIRDKFWNQRQVGTRVRMSKKERLALRKELGNKKG